MRTGATTTVECVKMTLPDESRLDPHPRPQENKPFYDARAVRYGALSRIHVFSEIVRNCAHISLRSSGYMSMEQFVRDHSKMG